MSGPDVMGAYLENRWRIEPATGAWHPSGTLAAPKLRHFTENGVSALCQDGEGEALVWSWRSVTCPDCLERLEASR